MHRSLYIALLFLSSCAATDPDEGRFVVNSRTLTKLDSAKVSEIRSSWQGATEATQARSAASKADVRWSLDFISNIESGGIKPCSRLELTEIKQLEIHPVRSQDANGKPLRFSPRTYYEAWMVTACGSKRQWRIFDEGTDPRNPHRVILWAAA